MTLSSTAKDEPRTFEAFAQFDGDRRAHARAA
jgi:hypothetical protein